MKSYPVIIRKKVPFLSEFLFVLFGSCCIILAVCFFAFMPSLDSSNEMKVVTTVVIIPNYAKWLVLFSGIGFIIFHFLYKHLILNKKGVLSFTAANITIATKKKNYQIPILSIRAIELIDPEDLNEMPKGKFFVVITQDNLEITQFQLVDYYDSDPFIDDLLKYESLKDHIKNPERLDIPDILNPED